MLSFLLGLVLGFVVGVVTKHLLKPKQSPQDIVDEIMMDFRTKEKGDFIKVNKVEEYLKENPGEVRLGDILEDE